MKKGNKNKMLKLRQVLSHLMFPAGLLGCLSLVLSFIFQAQREIFQHIAYGAFGIFAGTILIAIIFRKGIEEAQAEQDRERYEMLDEKGKERYKQFSEAFKTGVPFAVTFDKSEEEQKLPEPFEDSKT